MAGGAAFIAFPIIAAVEVTFYAAAALDTIGEGRFYVGAAFPLQASLFMGATVTHPPMVGIATGHACPLASVIASDTVTGRVWAGTCPAASVETLEQAT